MASYRGDSDFNHERPIQTGVLLLNLGTPDAPTPAAVRRYLAEFLWDPRIVELPRLLWWLILHGVILRIRPRRSAANYQKIWTEQGSPILAIARRQQAKLSQSLAQTAGREIPVELAMRYGNPSIADALERLRQANVRRILVLPLYPQYSCSTTGSTFDAVTAELRNYRWVPELRFINHYHDDAGYIGALADSIRSHWQQQGGPAQKLLFSFHGTPKAFLDKGDPYYCHCQKTTRLVVERLGLKEDQWQLCFQSRFGRGEWLGPATIETLEQWGKTGLESVDVICPGFSADCLETLEEIQGENCEAFQHAGGKQFRYIPALNENDAHIKALQALVMQHGQGWLEWPDQESAATTRRQKQAQSLGAKA